MNGWRTADRICLASFVACELCPAEWGFWITRKIRNQICGVKRWDELTEKSSNAIFAFIAVLCWKSWFHDFWVHFSWLNTHLLYFGGIYWSSLLLPFTRFLFVLFFFLFLLGRSQREQDGCISLLLRFRVSIGHCLWRPRRTVRHNIFHFASNKLDKIVNRRGAASFAWLRFFKWTYVHINRSRSHRCCNVSRSLPSATLQLNCLWLQIKFDVHCAPNMFTNNTQSVHQVHWTWSARPQ